MNTPICAKCCRNGIVLSPQPHLYLLGLFLFFAVANHVALHFTKKHEKHVLRYIFGLIS